ncbi:type I-MYXAN CRISPR-associated protein Cas5/Cmx5/DevS [Deferrisoma camini]|uniref:type I-MYXAN CRISPR-associated protein Cas5/Cmx5/DevS n=1 Tax=Deferrisoma camini TaxID=1035120 RepID=UPI00046D650A|nr:type I-MYXAN CRISPR-associated protein Cas5/Cmx5/DevS [Deferrisoma camini]
MLTLYLQAPFATFRHFTAGSFRPTAGFLTPSAAYGLLLNVAGIEMRIDEGREMTVVRQGLPAVRLALGALSMPIQHFVYQQLHNYPVGKDAGKNYAAGARGNKYNISPVRRAFLSGIRAYVCMDGNPELEKQVLEGVAGRGARGYGLPFLGDNSFLIDRLEAVERREPAYWFERIEGGDGEGIRPGTSRLTVTIDRANMAGTRSFLYAPTEHKTVDIPERAWTEVAYS